MSITIIPYLAFFTFRPTDQILLRSSIKLFSITDIAAGIVATGGKDQRERDGHAPKGTCDSKFLEVHKNLFYSSMEKIFPASILRAVFESLGSLVSLSVFTVFFSPSISNARVAPSAETSILTFAPITIGTFTSS